MSEHKNIVGQIEVAEEVISVIAVTAALEVEGIATTVSKHFVEFFGKRGHTKCIRIEKEENAIIIDMEIVVNFGVKVPQVAKEVQKKVQIALETMTGMEVKAVNVVVCGIIKEKIGQEEIS